MTVAEKGTVVEIGDDVAKIELDEIEACGRCGLCRSAGRGKMLMEVDLAPGLEPGRKVLIEGGDKSWAASILLFLVPMVALVAGLMLGQYVSPWGLSQESSSAILGALFLVISFAGAILCERRLRSRRPPVRPHIVMIYKHE
jgi:positive regulator of sigma E activity